MENHIQLSKSEANRLDRILSCSDLSKQRKIAVPFFILTIITTVLTLVIAYFDLFKAVFLVPFTMVPFFIGMARVAYYKLFRLIHYQAIEIEKYKR